MNYISIPSEAYNACANIAGIVKTANKNISSIPGIFFEGLLHSGDEVIGTTYTDDTLGDFEFVTTYRDTVKDSSLTNSSGHGRGHHGGVALDILVMEQLLHIAELVSVSNQNILANNRYTLDDLRVEVRLVTDDGTLIGTTEGEFDKHFNLVR